MKISPINFDENRHTDRHRIRLLSRVTAYPSSASSLWANANLYVVRRYGSTKKMVQKCTLFHHYYPIFEQGAILHLIRQLSGIDETGCTNASYSTNLGNFNQCVKSTGAHEPPPMHAASLGSTHSHELSIRPPAGISILVTSISIV